MEAFHDLQPSERAEFLKQLANSLTDVEHFKLAHSRPIADILSLMPLELSHMVCEFINLQTLAKMELVSKRWKHIVDSGVQWKLYANCIDATLKPGKLETTWKQLAVRAFTTSSNFASGKVQASFMQRIHFAPITAVHVLPPHNYAQESDTGVYPRTVITASKDRKVRLWTLGHDNGRLSADSHGSGIYLTWKNEFDTQLPVLDMKVVQLQDVWFAVTHHHRRLRVWKLATSQMLAEHEVPCYISVYCLHSAQATVFFYSSSNLVEWNWQTNSFRTLDTIHSVSAKFLVLAYRWRDGHLYSYADESRRSWNVGLPKPKRDEGEVVDGYVSHYDAESDSLHLNLESTRSGLMRLPFAERGNDNVKMKSTYLLACDKRRSICLRNNRLHIHTMDEFDASGSIGMSAGIPDSTYAAVWSEGFVTVNHEGNICIYLFKSTPSRRRTR